MAPLPELAALSAGWFASAAGGAVSDALAAEAEFVGAGLAFALPVVDGELEAGCAGCAAGWAGVAGELATGAEEGWMGAAG